jgi:soluble lytic murein transglycosylase-like protein
MAKDYSSYVVKMADKHGVPSDIALAVYEIESSKGRNAGTSTAGARGQMQLMPGTAKDLGVDIDDPFQNIEGGVRYLKQQLKEFKDPTVAAAAYNAGPGNVRKYKGIPPFKETRDYVRKFVNIVGPQSLMAQAKMPKASKSVSVDLKPATPYTPKQVDIAAATEENFASLLSGLGKKKRGKKSKPRGILAGLI